MALNTHNGEHMRHSTSFGYFSTYRRLEYVLINSNMIRDKGIFDPASTPSVSGDVFVGKHGEELKLSTMLSRFICL